jgi:hypothetical protein
VTLNRKGLRSDLKTKLSTLTGVAGVFKSLPKSPNGLSPIITIESNGSLPTSTPSAPQAVGIVIGIAARRDDADTAEDAIDDILDLVIAKLDKEYNYTLDGPTRTDYEVLDGVTYRLEWIEATFEWW